MACARCVLASMSVFAQYEQTSHMEQKKKRLHDTHIHYENSGVCVVSVCLYVCASVDPWYRDGHCARLLTETS